MSGSWQYKVGYAAYNGTHVMEVANAEAAIGWELVAVLPRLGEQSAPLQADLVFKRAV